MKQIYYNPVRYPRSIKYVNRCGNVVVVSKSANPNDLVFLGDLYRVLGLYQDIIVELTSDNEAYYPEFIDKDENGEYKRVTVVGEISLKEYRDGGGYFDDPRIYPNDNRLKDGALAWRL